MRRKKSFTERDILRNCGHASFHDGARDLAQGRVLEIEADGDEYVEGDVESGSGRTVYSVSIEGGSGSRRRRHQRDLHLPGPLQLPARGGGAARGAERHRRPAPAAAPPTPEERAARLLRLQDSTTDDTLSPELTTWVARLDQVRKTGSEEFPPDIDRRLIYVVLALPGRGGTAPRLAVAPMQARILKSGAMSAKARPVDPHSLGYVGSPPQYLRPSDRRILKALGGRMRETDGDGPPAYPLVDQTGAGILDQVLATGRARFETVLGPALAAGPPRPGHLAWIEGEETLTPRPVLDGEAEGSTVLALAAQPPAYLDPEAGLVGPIEVGLPPHLAAALLAAPPVPASAAPALNAALAKQVPGLDLRLPEPPRETVVDQAPVPVLRLTQIEVPAPISYYPIGQQPPPEPCASPPSPSATAR